MPCHDPTFREIVRTLRLGETISVNAAEVTYEAIDGNRVRLRIRNSQSPNVFPVKQALSEPHF